MDARNASGEAWSSGEVTDADAPRGAGVHAEPEDQASSSGRSSPAGRSGSPLPELAMARRAPSIEILTSNGGDWASPGSLDDVGPASVELTRVLQQIDDVLVDLVSAHMQGPTVDISEVAALVEKLHAGGMTAQAAGWRLFSLIRTRAVSASNSAVILSTDVIEIIMRLVCLAGDDGPGSVSRDAWIALPVLTILLTMYAPDPEKAERRLFAAMEANRVALGPALAGFFGGESDLALAAHSAYILSLIAIRGAPADVAQMLAARSPAGVSLAEQIATNLRNSAEIVAALARLEERQSSSVCAPADSDAVPAAAAAAAVAGLSSISDHAAFLPRVSSALRAMNESPVPDTASAMKAVYFNCYLMRFLVTAAESSSDGYNPPRAALLATDALERLSLLLRIPPPFYMLFFVLCGLVSLYVPNDDEHDQLLEDAGVVSALSLMLRSEDTFHCMEAIRGFERLLMSERLRPAAIAALLECLGPDGGLARDGAAQVLTKLASKSLGTFVAGGLVDSLLTLLQDDDDVKGSSLAVEPLAEAARNAAARALILPVLREMLTGDSAAARARAVSAVYRAAGKPSSSLRKEIMDAGIGTLLVQLLTAAAAATTKRRRSSSISMVPSVDEGAATEATEAAKSSGEWTRPPPPPPLHQVGILLGAVLRLVALPAARDALAAAGLSRGLVEPFLRSDDAFVRKTASAVMNFLRRATSTSQLMPAPSPGAPGAGPAREVPS